MDKIKAGKVVFSSETIQDKIRDIGRLIDQDFAGKDLILVGVLKGSLYFLADLSRAISMPVQLDFMNIGTIPNTTNETGIVRITKDIELDINGKHVLVIEDIIRTGLTTAYLVQSLRAHLPASISVCTLLVNPDQIMINVPIAYRGFEISKTRLIGYGMDIQESGRNLPYIAEVEGGEK